MEKLACAAAMALAAVGGVARTSQAAVIINEVYGGGASTNTTTSYQQDFVELYNNGTSAVDITGYTLQYGSATGAFPTTTASNSVTFPSFSLPAGGYFLVAGASNTTPGAALPTPDATSGIQAAATAGKLQLLDSTGAQVDLVGYGTTANLFEGSAAATSPSITTSISRTGGIDTNQNSLDFTAGAPTPTASGVPEPTSLGLAVAGALMICRRRR
jgi:hypothetical protein